MQQELHKCPSLFTTTKANVAVMVRMSSDASRLAVWAATQDGKSFKKEFAEEQIAQVKDRTKPTPWDKFFEELQGAFNRGAVECADGINVDFRTSGDAGVTVRLALDPTTEDAQKAIMDGLLLYHFVHANTKDAERQLEEAMRKEFELRTMSADLEKEEQQLNSIIEHSKTQDKVNKQHLEELRAELTKLEAEHKGDPSMDEDEESITCRARNPLFDKTHKDYDTELLRLVKSKWTSAEQPPNPIIRPYTASELMQHTQNWTSLQRQDLWECLKKIEDWDYDVFKVQQLMSGDDHYSLATQPRGGSLFVTMYALLFRHNLLAHFKLDEQILLNWLSMVEAGYHGNPYHNSMHAADVLQITNYLLTKGGLIEKCKLTPEDILAALFAASIHDFDHPGINNSFLMRANTHLATLYNDRSVLENRHVSSVFELMKLAKFNILACLTEDQRRDIHDTVVEMVLATDMGLHTRYVQQWKRRIGENHELMKRDDQRLALAMALKMADISNCGRPHHIYMKWGAKISDEFYMQGDRERNFGLPCSPFMDRQQPAMARGQISFMNFVVLPMFESISEFLPNMHFSVEQTEANKTYWNNNPDE